MGIEGKADRRRRQKQALEVEAYSITLPLRIALEVVHHLAPGSPKPTVEPPAPITSKPGIAQACKREEKEKRKSKAKSKKRRKQKNEEAKKKEQK